MLSLGEEEAMISGVDVRTISYGSWCLQRLLAGSAVSFVGVIGFVGLDCPSRHSQIFRASHRWVIPGAALLGGSMMVVGDSDFSNAIISPRNPDWRCYRIDWCAIFFAYVYFKRK